MQALIWGCCSPKIWSYVTTSDGIKTHLDLGETEPAGIWGLCVKPRTMPLPTAGRCPFPPDSEWQDR